MLNILCTINFQFSNVISQNEIVENIHMDGTVNTKAGNIN